MPAPRSYAHAPRLPDTTRVAIETAVPGSGPVMLEIGAGRGAFTVAYAELHRDARVLAFEIKLKLATQLSEKLAAHGLVHARCYADDAGAALARLDPDASVQHVAIHFPDPWWKKKHAKRLVVQDTLVAQLARLVVRGGLVFVQTDVIDRAEAYHARFAASPHFASVGTGDAPWIDESPFAPARSNREVRAMADGLPIHRMAYTRV